MKLPTPSDRPRALVVDEPFPRDGQSRRRRSPRSSRTLPRLMYTRPTSLGIVLVAPARALPRSPRRTVASRPRCARDVALRDRAPRRAGACGADRGGELDRPRRACASDCSVPAGEHLEARDLREDVRVLVRGRGARRRARARAVVHSAAPAPSRAASASSARSIAATAASAVAPPARGTARTPAAARPRPPCSVKTSALPSTPERPRVEAVRRATRRQRGARERLPGYAPIANARIPASRSAGRRCGSSSRGVEPGAARQLDRLEVVVREQLGNDPRADPRGATRSSARHARAGRRGPVAGSWRVDRVADESVDEGVLRSPPTTADWRSRRRNSLRPSERSRSADVRRRGAGDRA